MSSRSRIYLLTPDHPHPSWGVGLLYGHVALLRARGFDARVLHFARPFRLGWLESDVPIQYLDDEDFSPGERDVVVVPEVLAASSEVPFRHAWRKVVFVQGSFLILQGSDRAFSYRDLGYEAAMAVLPHVARIVERHFGLPAQVVPPYIAEAFFEPPAEPRERRILLLAKEQYRIAGYPDFDIANLLLRRFLRDHPLWELRELAGLEHERVAALMRSSTFLINLNCLEAFNTTVPEAMAAGCIPICYEAFGGRDFLRDGENALVFANNHVFALLEKVFWLVEHHSEQRAQLEALRRGGRATAAGFSREKTAQALDRFFLDQLQVAP